MPSSYPDTWFILWMQRGCSATRNPVYTMDFLCPKDPETNAYQYTSNVELAVKPKTYREALTIVEDLLKTYGVDQHYAILRDIDNMILKKSARDRFMPEMYYSQTYGDK